MSTTTTLVELPTRFTRMIAAFAAIPPRVIGALALTVAAAALGLALGAEYWGGLVPCALCLLERWPYRVAIVLSLVAAVVPRPFDRGLLMLVVLTMLVGAALAVVHVGVELNF